jgi:hypothetical protein
MAIEQETVNCNKAAFQNSIKAVKCVLSTNAIRIWSTSENIQMPSKGKQNREDCFWLNMNVDGN